MTVTVNNKGSEKLSICFVYLDGNSMTAQGWWSVDAGKSRAIKIGGKIGAGALEHFGRKFEYHATRGKSVWGNGSGGGMYTTSAAFKYDWITDAPDVPTDKMRHVKTTEIFYKGDAHTLTFN